MPRKLENRRSSGLCHLPDFVIVISTYCYYTELQATGCEASFPQPLAASSPVKKPHCPSDACKVLPVTLFCVRTRVMGWCREWCPGCCNALTSSPTFCSSLGPFGKQKRLLSWWESNGSQTLWCWHSLDDISLVFPFAVVFGWLVG